ncbi:MAG: hypothetical protein R2748_05500 [Bryobacterales bacterium]
MSIGLIGCLLLLGVVGLRFYLAFEILLALPTLILFAMIAISNAPPGLAFSPLDLVLPAIPFTLVSGAAGALRLARAEASTRG